MFEKREQQNFLRLQQLIEEEKELLEKQRTLLKEIQQLKEQLQLKAKTVQQGYWFANVNGEVMAVGPAAMCYSFMLLCRTT